MTFSCCFLYISTPSWTDKSVFSLIPPVDVIMTMENIAGDARDEMPCARGGEKLCFGRLCFCWDDSSLSGSHLETAFHFYNALKNVVNIKTVISQVWWFVGVVLYTQKVTNTDVYVQTCTHSTRFINCLGFFFQQLYGFVHLASLAQSHCTLTLLFFPYILLRSNFPRGKPKSSYFISTTSESSHLSAPDLLGIPSILRFTASWVSDVPYHGYFAVSKSTTLQYNWL